MSKNLGVPPLWLQRCAASLLLLLAGCSQVPPTSSAAIPPLPGGGARIWIYRNEGPYESHDRPYLRLNGQVSGIVEPNGALYRDLPAGHYVVTVDSYGVPYPNQFAQLDLAAGQEVFIKVLSMRERVGGGENVSLRALFFTEIYPAEAARPAIASTPFYGSS
jgi:hypothetical protein